MYTTNSPDDHDPKTLLRLTVKKCKSASQLLFFAKCAKFEDKFTPEAYIHKSAFSSVFCLKLMELDVNHYFVSGRNGSCQTGFNLP